MYAPSGVIAGVPSGGAPILVASGVAGSGTTTISALLGIAMAGLGLEVLLVQGDAERRDLASLFRAPEPASEQSVVQLGEGLWLAGPSFADSGRFDQVVVDAGATLRTVLECGGRFGGELVLVAREAGLALAAGYALLKSVHRGFPQMEMSVVANRTAAAEQLFATLQGAADGFLCRSVAAVGSVPEEVCLAAASRRGMRFIDAVEGSHAAAEVSRIATTMLSRQTAVPAERRTA